MFSRRCPMPFLAAEPQIFPEHLFEPSQALATERSWWVLYTKPRQEKSLARQLVVSGIPFYLPLFSKRLRIRNRLFVSHLPLFSGYVFLLATGEERVAALATKRIVRPIRVADQSRMWADLAQI